LFLVTTTDFGVGAVRVATTAILQVLTVGGGEALYAKNLRCSGTWLLSQVQGTKFTRIKDGKRYKSSKITTGKVIAEPQWLSKALRGVQGVVEDLGPEVFLGL
jgi:hypothetical protein